MTVNSAPSYSPDGTKISFQSNRDGDAEIYVMNANGSSPVNLTNSPLSLEASPDWQPLTASLVIIDEDSIDKGSPPNFFFDFDVNDDIAALGLRATLPAFAGANVGTEISLYTGEVGDEGWFALTSVPDAWAAADPDPATDTDGLTNYILAGPGLGTDNDPEALLDKIPGVTPLRATGLELLVGQQVCAVVQDSDVSINYDPLDGSLKGASLGRVAFKVLSVTPLTGASSSSLPVVAVEILNAEEICEGDLSLFEDAPVPISSSEPSDTGNTT